MKNNIIMFNSVTHALRGRDVLNKYKITAVVVRTPAHIRNKSCGYSLVLKDNLDYAVGILNEHRIPIFGVVAADSE